MTSPRARALLGFTTLAAVAVVATLPFWMHADTLPRGDNLAQHVQFVRGFSEGLREGWLYPRWLAAANLGYGAPAFIFYPPAGTALVALIERLGLPLFASFRLGILFLTLAAAMGAAHLGRRTSGAGGQSPGQRRIIGGLCGALLVLLPYHALDRFNRFALAELAAFVFVPLFFAALERAPRRRLPLLTLSFAGLCFSHLPMAYLAAWFGVLWACTRDRRAAAVGVTVLALVIGAGCASVYWLPAVAERGDTHAEWLESNPVYRFDQHWLFSSGRVDVSDDPILGAGRTHVELPTVPRVRLTALATLAVLVLAWTLRLRDRTTGDSMIRYLVVGTASTVAMTRLADPLWRWIPGLASVAFPWRLTTFLTLATAVVTADTLIRLAAARRLPQVMILGTAAVVAMALSGWLATGADWTTFTRERADLPAVRKRVAGVFMPKSSRFMRGLPLRAPYASPVVVARSGEATAGVAETVLDENHERHYRVRVEGTGPAFLDAPMFDYPHWEVQVDGIAVDHARSPRLGTVRVAVPPGAHEVRIRFRNSRVRKAAAGISAVFIVSFLVLTGLRLDRTMFRQRELS